MSGNYVSFKENLVTRSGIISRFASSMEWSMTDRCETNDFHHRSIIFKTARKINLNLHDDNKAEKSRISKHSSYNVIHKKFLQSKIKKRINVEREAAMAYWHWNGKINETFIFYLQNTAIIIKIRQKSIQWYFETKMCHWAQQGNDWNWSARSNACDEEICERIPKKFLLPVWYCSVQLLYFILHYSIK